MLPSAVFNSAGVSIMGRGSVCIHFLCTSTPKSHAVSLMVYAFSLGKALGIVSFWDFFHFPDLGSVVITR